MGPRFFGHFESRPLIGGGAAIFLSFGAPSGCADEALIPRDFLRISLGEIPRGFLLGGFLGGFVTGGPLGISLGGIAWLHR